MVDLARWRASSVCGWVASRPPPKPRLAPLGPGNFSLCSTTANTSSKRPYLCPCYAREILRIEGEYVYRVPPLDLPPQHEEMPDTVLRHGAMQLFIARMKAQNGNFVPQEENLPAITAICRHLDGVPLAIELAAARAATLGPLEVASHLDDRFGLLTDHRTASPRHRTLRATLDWGYELLREPEPCLLRRMDEAWCRYVQYRARVVFPAHRSAPIDLI